MSAPVKVGATRIRPGVIVSTIVNDDGRAQTVVFSRNRATTVGFDMDITYAPAGQAWASHVEAVSRVSDEVTR